MNWLLEVCLPIAFIAKDLSKQNFRTPICNIFIEKNLLDIMISTVPDLSKNIWPFWNVKPLGMLLVWSFVVKLSYNLIFKNSIYK